MNIFLPFLTLILCLTFLNACNQNPDREPVSQARGDIIKRSGTILTDEKEALIDAQNRLRTGGGLLGKKPVSVESLLNNNNEKGVVGSMGLPINAVLWKSSLETVEFMPLASADPFGGIIITDWYSSQSNNKERCKLNIFIKGSELKADNIRVGSFCQTLDNNGLWLDKGINHQHNRELENAILNKAKKIKLSSQ
tara:strand:- start:417 stop:1001 length:585 start_codon:yes stop_codon:yes gene_type:complete